mmetsp:Transcript_16121/g.20677  ORF Transcript_16121/g.20677 Transcript_16121/m.20677 type:complete len:447 (+) Transcript_16121:1-1341(+)
MENSTDANNATSSSNHMPVWINDSKIDPSWIRGKMSNFQHVSGCLVKDISNGTRKGDVTKNGATLLLQLTSEDSEDGCGPKTATMTTLVAKQVPPTGLALSRRLGLAREAIFYNQLAPKIRLSSSNGKACIPKIYYCSGDMSDGSKIVMMEDLSDGFIDSGILFGPGNPNNWNRDLKRMVDDAFPPNASNKSTAPSSFEVANQTFLAIANVHATFWRDAELLKEEYKWLRGSSWISGKDEDTWRASQGMIQSMWEKYMEGEEDDGRIHWDPLVWRIVEKAMSGISWESQIKRLNVGSHFCLVHGDFWPGNVMISNDNSVAATREMGAGRDLRLLDWEMVGLGSGPQDLGQYILSNMDPKERRECEEELIRNYYEKLVRLGVQNFSWEDCWSEYKIGGLERWLWFLVYFCAQEGPVMTKWAQFFHNQIKEFVHDHKIRPEDITQPRP